MGTPELELNKHIKIKTIHHEESSAEVDGGDWGSSTIF